MPSDDRPGRGPSRRAVLTAVGLAAGGLLWANSDRIVPPLRDAVDDFADGIDTPARLPPRRDPTPVHIAQLTGYERLGGSRLVYEVDASTTRLAMQQDFATRLDASFRSHWQATGWGVPSQLWSYGTWINLDARPRASWHHEGRAFDLSRVRTSGGRELVNCRYDRWGSTTGARRAELERSYWRMTATLHRDFASVLTYLYDAAHHNHIHVDDGRSDAEGSTFSSGSRIQVQAVQAMCRHVWRLDVEPTGRWDGATRSATGEILDRIGVGGRLTGGRDEWRAFLGATARSGD